MQVFMFLYRKLNNMDGVKQQDSTPQNDSTLGFKWIKKIAQNIVYVFTPISFHSCAKLGPEQS
jgi:hypothetical protein